MFKTQR